MVTITTYERKGVKTRPQDSSLAQFLRKSKPQPNPKQSLNPSRTHHSILMDGSSFANANKEHIARVGLCPARADDTYKLMEICTTIAPVASWQGCIHGVPFGGTMSWTLIVIMSNDSGDYPYAPFQAAMIGFPITIMCDLVFFIPALFVAVYYCLCNI